MDALRCIQADATFGPQILPSCRTFDFTRLFEEWFFSILPSALFLALATVRSWRIFFEQPVVRKGKLHMSKIVAIGLLAVTEIAQLVLWAKSLNLKTQATISSNVLRMVVTLFMLFLSHLEHYKSFRPSSLLCAYLFFTLLLDIPQARTLWISHQLRGRATSVIFPVTMGIKVIILLLEARGKIRLLLKQTGHRWSPEEITNIFSRRLFWWLNSLFNKGYKKALSLSDLFVLDEGLSSKKLGDLLVAKWNHRRKNYGKYTLALCLAEIFKWQILAPIFPRLLLTCFTFSQPFLVQSVTSFLKKSRESAPDYLGYGLIGAYGLVYSGIALSNGWYWHKQYRLITMIRGSLVSIVFSKTLRTELGALTGSQATTLMSADVERIAASLSGLHELWACALELGIGLWLLYRQVGLAMLSMAGLTLICTFAASKIAQYSTTRQKAWMIAMELRLSDTIKMLSSLKSIKMLGLEQKLQKNVQALRQKEINSAVNYRIVITLVIILAHANLFLNPVLVFSAFLPIASKDDLLFTSERVFNTLTLVALVTEPLQNLLQSLPLLAMALGCIGRIQAYLLTADHRDSRLCSSSDFDNSSLIRITVDSDTDSESAASFVVRNGHFGWLAGSPAVLRNVNIRIPSGKLTLLVGPVGCGKTTLLHTLLGETVHIKGQVWMRQKTAAFCSQQPWLTNTTIRNTIIGHSPENLYWYEQVVKACALHQDFATLGEGDQTTIGSGGSSLSGGQKQRVALARALYAKRPVLLLDDIFSGLDKSTEQAVFDALFGMEGLFHTSLAGTTVVFATHTVRLLKSADHIIALLPNGDGASQGTLKDLQSQGVLSPSPKYSEQWDKEDSGQQKEPFSGNEPANFRSTFNSKTEGQEKVFSDKKVLAYYLKSMGLWNLTTFTLVGGISVGLWKVSDYWARIWSDHSMQDPLNSNNSFYLGIYALLNSVALITISFWFAHFLLLVMPKTGVTFHENILNTVLNASYPFLSTTDTGSLATRFGQDLLLIDTELPMAFVNTLFQIFVLLAQLGLIASASVYLISAFPVLAVAIYIVQRIYLKTSKRIRHLDLEAKAPLYAQFTDTFGGIASIRAFGWQDSMREENDQVLNNSQRPFYLLFCVQRWLECVLDFVVAALAVIVMGVALATRADVGSAQIGVALLNLVTLGENLKSLVKYWTMLETTIAAVARIQDFVNTTTQEPMPLLSHEEKGPDSSDMSITLNNISASYSRDGPNVLSSLTLHIAAGERIAVCGRSGSGKSSFLSTLLKMTEISDGELIIFGRSSTSLGNQELRQRLNTIPQDPYFHPGTVRQNLDPETGSTDADMTDILVKVGLADKIADLGGLDAELAIEKFSAGQLQLLSLGRAMIKPKGIVLLDEATSNVDNDTDRKMHNIIFEHFTGQTIVANLHRREHLHLFDRVALMDRGRLVQIGKPSEVNLDM